MQTLPSLIPETLYTSEEVSEYLRLSLRTVQRLLQTKALPAYKIHGQYRIKGIDLLHYLDGVRQSEAPELAEANKPADLIQALEVKPVLIKFGVNWLPRIQAPEFMDKLQNLRKDLVYALGFILPGVQLQDCPDLPPDVYAIELHGTPLIQAEFAPAQNYTQPKTPSKSCFSLPYLGSQTFCIDAQGKLGAEDLLLMQLQALLRRYAYEILCRDEVAVILEQVRKSRPTVVEEVLSETPQPGQLTIGQLTHILRYLLEEQVSIRNMALILEILANHLPQEQNLDRLAEKVRQGLARQINAPLVDTAGIIQVMAFEPKQEAELKTIFQAADPTPEQTQWAQRLLKALTAKNRPDVLICALELRRKIAQILARKYPQVTVLSYQEIAKEVQIELAQTLHL